MIITVHKRIDIYTLTWERVSSVKFRVFSGTTTPSGSSSKGFGQSQLIPYELSTLLMKSVAVTPECCRRSTPEVKSCLGECRPAVRIP